MSLIHWWSEIHFAYPWALIGLALPMLVAWRHWVGRSRAAIRVSSSRVFPSRVVDVSRWRHVALLIRVAAITLLVLSVSRPQIDKGDGKRSSEGLDIMLALDSSGSMRAMDFEIQGQRVGRLDVVKRVVGDFVAARTDDRIGIVVFGEGAFLQAPLTLDHDVLRTFLDGIRVGDAGENATAIGDALGLAVKRVKDIPAKSRIVILLTDGQNNAGTIDPRAAADAANALGIKVYTIGAGSRGRVPIPVPGPFGTQMIYQDVDIDEATLTAMAEATGGKYFRATDTDSLKSVYAEIDRLEKTRVEVKTFRDLREVGAWFLWPALVLVAMEWALAMTRRGRLV